MLKDLYKIDILIICRCILTIRILDKGKSCDVIGNYCDLPIVFPPLTS